MIFETHAHYDDKAFDDDRDQLIKSFPENGIGIAVNISSDIASVKKTIELTKKYSYLYGAVGIHPSETEELTEDNFLWLKEQCSALIGTGDKSANSNPLPGSCKRYAGYIKSCLEWEAKRGCPLFFLWEGNSGGVFKI